MKLFTNIKLAASRLMLKGKKYAPEICVGASIVIGAVGIYQACKSTLEVESIIDETKETLDKIKENEPKEGEEVKKFVDKDGNEQDYTKEIATKNKVTTYLRFVGKMAKTYWKASLLLILALILNLKGFGILKKRHIAMCAAYTGLKASYDKYRDAIKEKFGIDIDKAAILGLSEKIVTKETEDEKGNRSVVEEVEKTANKNPSDDSDYICLFNNHSSHHWKNNAEMNYAFLKSTEVYATQLLRVRGHVFLNEVYDALGMPRTQTGALCGWVLNSTGDNYVSFGIDDCYDAKNNMVIKDCLSNEPDKFNPDFWLEFNCQGTIFDKI